MYEMKQDEINSFIEKQVTVRAGIQDGESVYIVPLSYVYMNDKIYVHWFKEHCKKADLLRGNNNICLEIDEYTPDHLHRRSVIIKGKATKVENLNTKRNFVLKLKEKYPEFGKSKMAHIPEITAFIKAGMEIMVRKVIVFEVTILEVSGRKEDIPLR